MPSVTADRPATRGEPGVGKRVVSRAAGAVRQGSVLVAEQVPGAVLLLLLCMVAPTAMSFYVGTLRISPYRIMLLVMTPVLFLRLVTGAAGKLTTSDKLILAATLWMWASMLANDGFGGIESGGIGFLETCGAYLISRCCIRTAGQWLSTVIAMGIIVAVICPLAVLESLSGFNAIKTLVLGSGPGGAGGLAEADMRMGFYRAEGPFDHPILLGVIAAAVTSAVTLVALRKMAVAILAPFTLLATMCSISSGALAGLCVTGVLASWDRITRSVPRRWVVFLILFAVVYAILEVLSNRSALVAILSVVTLNPKTAMDRTLIWEWGFHHNAMVRPFFGMGKSASLTWIRPSWLSPSVDNYFLLLMMVHGVVAVVMLLVGILLKIRIAVLADRLPSVYGIASSWWIAMFAFVISGWTVALWNHAQMFFWFFIGAGSWIEQQYYSGRAAGGGRKRGSP